MDLKPCETHYVRNCQICAKTEPVRKADTVAENSESVSLPSAEGAPTDPKAISILKLSADYAKAVDDAAKAQLEVTSLEKLLASARESLTTAQEAQESARNGLALAVLPASQNTTPNL